ncbi:hypothetical protein EYF80_067854 [Liparis tanakae]|uniref:Uncharacterized protein n=1 Tax=Liparis tanakae TaxID=230148 RepID=A0A4Z2DZR4_9TELE|nr:hypothetical protein EYF80_067854 [Liparis tanakae]
MMRQLLDLKGRWRKKRKKKRWMKKRWRKKRQRKNRGRKKRRSSGYSAYWGVNTGHMGLSCLLVSSSPHSLVPDLVSSVSEPS